MEIFGKELWTFGQLLILNVNSTFSKSKMKTIWNIENCTKPVEMFGIDISKCYSFSENMAYFLAKTFDMVTNDHSVAKTDKLEQKGCFGLE